MVAPLGITLGDASGVGPELILRVGATLDAPVVVYGHDEVLRAARAALPQAIGPLAHVTRVSAPDEIAALPPGTLGVIRVAELDVPDPYPWGEAVADFGRLQHAALIRAIDDAMAARISGILTAPWHKARLLDAGLPPTGHTEVLAEASGTDDVVMLLAGDRLRVALVTTHLPLSEVPAAITDDRIVRVARIFEAGLRRRYGFASPRIAVCGLNPHAGESGVLGHEEQTVIAPAIARLRAEGLAVDGPFPADTIFPRVGAGEAAYDGVLAMYHDQGLGPLKTLHFGQAANITLGLPFIRTSVDHGTAYDIAGRGIADTRSFRYAAQLALDFAKRIDSE